MDMERATNLGIHCPMLVLDPNTDNPAGSFFASYREVDLIRALHAFHVTNLVANGGHMVDYERVTAPMFDHFRTHHYNPSRSYQFPDAGSSQAIRGSRQVQPNPIRDQPNATRAQPSKADQFRRGQKRQTADYPTFSRDSDYIRWVEVFRSIAQDHGTFNVLIPEYTPPDKDEAELFNVQNTFMYSVLSKVVTAPHAQSIVHNYANTFDAQSAFRALMERYISSPAAQAMISDLAIKISNARLTPSHTGSYEEWIDHFCQMIYDYENLVPPNSRYNDHQKVQMLHTALSGIDELNSTISQVNNGTMTGFVPTFLNVISIYKMNVVHLDRKRLGRSFKSKRNINKTLTTLYEDDEDTDDLCAQIQAWAVKRQVDNRKGNMPKEAWDAMSDDEKAAWKNLSVGTREKIMSARNSKLKSSGTSLGQRKVNFAHLELDDEDEAEDPPDEDTEPHDLQANKANAKPALKNNNSSKPSSTNSPGSLAALLGNTKTSVKTHVNMHKIRIASTRYIVSKAEVAESSDLSLVDRGANGGLAGSDVRVIAIDEDRKIAVTGFDNHQAPPLPTATVGAYMNSNKGPIIGIFHQYGKLHNDSRTIHSCVQLENYKIKVDDKSMRAGGLQCLMTPDGYAFPLDIVDGLPRLFMRPYSDEEFKQLPHVIFTSNQSWDPTCLDSVISGDGRWYNNVADMERNPHLRPFDEYGNYKHREGGPVHRTSPISDGFDVNHTAYVANLAVIQVMAHGTKVLDRDYESLRPFFLWRSEETIKSTYENTTQYARRRPQLGPMIRDTYKSPFPAFNVNRQHEPVATDTITSTVAAIGGIFAAQIFIGRISHVVDVFGMKSPNEFVNTLEDVIRKRGTMDKLISDRGTNEISSRVQDILRAYEIGEWQSEPHYQWQNHAERRWQDVKVSIQKCMDTSGAPPDMWFLCTKYVVYILNRLSSPSLKGKTPLSMINGQVPDISMIPYYRFYDEVYYAHYESTSPSVTKTTERLGYFAGFSENVGHAITFLVVSRDTRQILHRSRLRTVKDGERNLRADSGGNLDDDNASGDKLGLTKLPPDPGEAIADETPGSVETVPESEEQGMPTGEVSGNTATPGEGYKLSSTYERALEEGKLLPTIQPEEIIGQTFFLPEKNGVKPQAKVIGLIQQYEDDLMKNPEHVKFRCEVDGETYEDLISYSQVLDYIEDSKETSLTNTEKVWKFVRFTGHQGPLTQRDKDYNGSKYNLQIEWENGETTYEPLAHMIREDPISVAQYPKDHKLLDTPGWKQLKYVLKHKKNVEQMALKTTLKSFNHSPIYMFGVQVPRNHAEAMRLNKQNGNTLWADAEYEEVSSVLGFQSFKDLGHHQHAKIPKGYKKITFHFVCAVKHDGRRKARLVGGGHLTDTPVDSVYLSVVSQRGVRMTIYIAESNALQVWSTDVGNAYLESYTKELVYAVAGPEFTPFGLEGHVLVVVRALYGLKSSGQRWWERFAEVVRDGLGFFPCKAESDIWMRHKGDHYEYICVYVDDIIVCSRNPQEIIDDLTTVHKFTLKGTGPIHFHLGCDYVRDPDGTLCYGPRRYVDKMVKDFERMFGHPPRHYSSPIERGDHPELDMTKLLELDGVKQYQSIIGSLQWAVQLGRIDITTAVMSLSSYRAAPRVGHLNRAKRVVGYLLKMRNALIRIRTDIPDYSALSDYTVSWDQSVYRGAREIVPEDAPEPLGKPVIHTAYVDANLQHDVLTGRSVTGILHFFNRTPIDWYSKKQATVETATYGSEFMAARTAAEQTIAFRIALRYLGVPIQGSTHLFGDNKSVVDSAMIPHSQLAKRHLALSFHRVRETIAADILRFHWIDGRQNPADILSKHWGYQQVADQLHHLLFWRSPPKEGIG